MRFDSHILSDWQEPGLGKLEDVGELVEGGRIDHYWEKEGIDNTLENLFDVMPAEDFALKAPTAREHFNLRSIEFGNWMSQKDRANYLYGSMMGLHHLSQLLDIQPKQIGMSAKLSLALGARGKGNAAGHYEAMPYSIINLTKTAGTGVLCHEFGHAFDNIISFYTGGKRQSFVSGGRTTRRGWDENIAKKGNWFEQKFEELFNRLYFTEKGNPTLFSKELSHESEYYNRRAEVWARTFETYIDILLQEAGIKNKFLLSSGKGTGHPPYALVERVRPLIEVILKRGFQVMKGKPKQALSGIALSPTGYIGFRRTIKENASLDDTLRNMKRIALRDSWQVEALAKELQGATVAETAENIWNWIRTNTRYKEDKKGIEELRTPARSIYDGRLGLTNPKFGIDCDDFTILISAMLLVLEIEHEYKVAAYKEKGKFEHIYPVAFDEYGNSYVIDCVPEIPAFNYEEQPIIDLKTVSMELQELSGVGALSPEKESQQQLAEELNEPFTLSGIEDEEDEVLEEHFLSGFGEVDTEEEADLVLSGADDVREVLERGILAQVNKARQSLLNEQKQATALSKLVNVPKELEIFNQVMEAWEDEEDRKDAILEAINKSAAYQNFFKAILFSLDELEDESGQLSGFDNEEIFLARIVPSEWDNEDDIEDELNGLGLFRRKKSGTKKKGRLKNLFKKVGSTVKKGLKAVVRYNPATIVMRNAILLLLKVNFLKVSERLIYGYLTEQQATAKGLDLNEWRKVVDAIQKAEKFFTAAGGKAHNLKNAIVKGRARKKTGLNLAGLGTAAGAEVAAAAATATPFLAKVKNLLSKINPVKLFKNIAKKIKDKRAAKNASGGEEEAFTDTGMETDEELTETADTGGELDETEEAAGEGGNGGGSGGGSGSGSGFMAKLKGFWSKHKKNLTIGGIIAVIILIGVIVWKKIQQKKKNQLRGIKAAKTRARNRKRLGQIKGVGQLGRGSQTILKLPTSSVSNSKAKRVSKVSNGQRLKKMHNIAQELKKKHPKSKYSSLLKKAAQMI